MPSETDFAKWRRVTGVEMERVKLDVSVLQKPAITVRLEPCAKPFVPPEGAVKVPPLADLIFNYKLGVL